MSEQAGRELDAKVARFVMGWTKATLSDGVAGPEAYWCAGGKAMCLVDSFTPSTSIAAAWEVVERSRLLRWYVLGDYGGSWAVLEWGEDDYRVYAEADTAPLAICKAALKAVGAS